MRLRINNFRSIRQQELELAPITLVYGPNGAGKSSLLYALPTMKNIMLNPNQNPNGFFNYLFANLGSYESLVFNHEIDRQISFSVEIEEQEARIRYEIDLSDKSGGFILCLDEKSGAREELKLPVSFPYPANQQSQITKSEGDRSFTINWNGVIAQVQPSQPDEESQQRARQLMVFLNTPTETLRKVGIIPLKRGFSKTHFQTTPVGQMILEDEIAALLSMDKYLESKVSVYLERIFKRDFRVHVTPGTALFSLDATDRETGLGTELVNDGFGVNQIVYLLARCLHREAQWLCIEEPEIHLHPSAIRNLARVLVQIVREEGKRFLISTHSENLLTALLTLVSSGELSGTELACYYARKEKKETVFELQKINEKGQIEGGLASFLEAELSDLKVFLKTGEK